MATSKQNLNSLRDLLVALSALRESERRACWGRPLGSRALWGHHDHIIARINNIADGITIQEVIILLFLNLKLKAKIMHEKVYGFE